MSSAAAAVLFMVAILAATANAQTLDEFKIKDSSIAQFRHIGRNVRCTNGATISNDQIVTSRDTDALVTRCALEKCKDENCGGIGVDLPVNRPFQMWSEHNAWETVSIPGPFPQVGQLLSSTKSKTDYESCKSMCVNYANKACGFMQYGSDGKCTLYATIASSTVQPDPNLGNLLRRTLWRRGLGTNPSAQLNPIHVPGGEKECQSRCAHAKNSLPCQNGYGYVRQQCNSAWTSTAAPSALPTTCGRTIYASIDQCKRVCAADSQCKVHGFIAVTRRFKLTNKPEFAVIDNHLIPPPAVDTDDAWATAAHQVCRNKKGAGWRAASTEDADLYDPTESDRSIRQSEADRRWGSKWKYWAGRRRSSDHGWRTANTYVPNSNPPQLMKYAHSYQTKTVCFKPHIEDKSLIPSCVLLRSDCASAAIATATAVNVSQDSVLKTQIHYRLQQSSSLTCTKLSSCGFVKDTTNFHATWPASKVSMYAVETLYHHKSKVSALATQFPSARCKAYQAGSCTLPYVRQFPLASGQSGSLMLELGLRRDIVSNGKVVVPIQGDFSQINGDICMAHQPQFEVSIKCSTAVVNTGTTMTSSTHEGRIQECSRKCQQQVPLDGNACQTYGFAYHSGTRKCLLLSQQSSCGTGDVTVYKYRNIAVLASADVQCDASRVNGTRRVVHPLPCAGGKFVDLSRVFRAQSNSFNPSMCSSCAIDSWTPPPVRKCTPAQPYTTWSTDGGDSGNVNVKWEQQQLSPADRTQSACEQACLSKDTCSGYKHIDSVCTLMTVTDSRRAAVMQTGKRAVSLFVVECATSVLPNGMCENPKVVVSDSSYPSWNRVVSDQTSQGKIRYSGHLPALFYGNEDTIEKVMSTATICVMRGIGRAPDDDCAYGNGVGTVQKSKMSFAPGSNTIGNSIYMGTVEIPPLGEDKLVVYLMMDAIQPGSLLYIAPGIGMQYASRMRVNEALGSSKRKFNFDIFDPKTEQLPLDQSDYLRLAEKTDSQLSDPFLSHGTVALANNEKHTAAGMSSFSSHLPRSDFSCSALMTAVPNPAGNAWGDIRSSVLGSCMSDQVTKSSGLWSTPMPVWFGDGLKGGKDYVLRSGGVAAYVKDLKYEFTSYAFKNTYDVQYPFHFTLNSIGSVSMNGEHQGYKNSELISVITGTQLANGDTQVVIARKDDPPAQASTCTLNPADTGSTAVFWASNVAIQHVPKIKTQSAWALLADALCAELKGPEWRSASKADADHWNPDGDSNSVRMNEDDRRWRDWWGYWSYSNKAWLVANPLQDAEKYQKPMCVNLPQKKRVCNPQTAVLVQWPKGQPFPLNVIHDITYPSSAEISLTTIVYNQTTLGKLHITTFRSSIIRKGNRYALFYRTAKSPILTTASKSYAASCPLTKVYYNCLPKTQCDFVNYYMSYGDSISKTAPGRCQLRRTCPPGVARITTSLYTDSICLLPVSPIPLCRNLIAFMANCRAKDSNSVTGNAGSNGCACTTMITTNGYDANSGGVYNMPIYYNTSAQSGSASIDGHQLSLYDYPKNSMTYLPSQIGNGRTCAAPTLKALPARIVEHKDRGVGCTGYSSEWLKQESIELSSFYTFQHLTANASSNTTYGEVEYGYSDAAKPIGGETMGGGGDAWATWADGQCHKKFGNGWRSMSTSDAAFYKWYGNQVDRWWRGELKYWDGNVFRPANGIEAYGYSRQAVCIKPPASTLEECKQQCVDNAFCIEHGFSFVLRSGSVTFGDCRFPTIASKTSSASFAGVSLYRKTGCVYMKVPHYQYKTGHTQKTLSFPECRFECNRQPGCPDKGFTWSGATGNDCRLPQEGTSDLQFEAEASTTAAYYSVSSIPNPSNLALHYEKLTGFGHGTAFTSYAGLSAEDCRIKCQEVAGCPARGFSWYRTSSGSRQCRIPTEIADADTIERWDGFAEAALYRLPAYRVVLTDDFEVVPTLTEKLCKERWQQVATSFSTLSSTQFGFLSVGYGHVHRKASLLPTACTSAESEDVPSSAPHGRACKKAIRNKKGDPTRCSECNAGFVLHQLNSDCSGRCLPELECRIVKRGVNTPPLVATNNLTTVQSATFYQNEERGIAGVHRLITQIKGWDVKPKLLDLYQCANTCGPSTRYFVRGTATELCDAPSAKCPCTCVAVGSPVCKPIDTHSNLTLYDIGESFSDTSIGTSAFAAGTSSYRIYMRDANCVSYSAEVSSVAPNVTRVYPDTSQRIQTVAECAQVCSSTHNTPFFEFPNWKGAFTENQCSYTGCASCVCVSTGEVNQACHKSVTARADLFQVIPKVEQKIIRTKHVKVCQAGTYSSDGTIPKLLRYCESDNDCCTGNITQNQCKEQPYARCVTVRKNDELHRFGCGDKQYDANSKANKLVRTHAGWTLYRKTLWTPYPDRYLEDTGPAGTTAYIKFPMQGAGSLEECKTACVSSRRCRALGFYMTTQTSTTSPTQHTCYIPNPEVLIQNVKFRSSPAVNGRSNVVYLMDVVESIAGAMCSTHPQVSVEVNASTPEQCMIQCELSSANCLYFGYSFNQNSKTCRISSKAFQPWIQVCAPVITGTTFEEVAPIARALKWPCHPCPPGHYSEFPGAKSCQPFRVTSASECSANAPVYIKATSTFGGRCVSKTDANLYTSPRVCPSNTYKKTVYERVKNPVIRSGYRDVDGEWYAPRSPTFKVATRQGVSTLDLCRDECFNQWGGIDSDVNSEPAGCRAITWDATKMECHLFKNRRIEGKVLFQLTRFVDTQRFYTRTFVNGRDIERSECTAKTACPPGQYADFADDNTRDNQCRLCPAGTWTLGGVGNTLLRSSSVQQYSTSWSGNIEDYLYAARSISDCYPCSSGNPLQYYPQQQYSSNASSSNTSHAITEASMNVTLRDAYNQIVFVERGKSPVACCPSSVGLGSTCAASNANGRAYFYPYTKSTDLSNPAVVNYAKNFDVCWHCKSCGAGSGPSLVQDPTRPDGVRFGVCLPCRKDTKSVPQVNSLNAHVCEPCQTSPTPEYTTMSGASECKPCTMSVADPTLPGFQSRCSGWPNNDKFPPGFYLGNLSIGATYGANQTSTGAGDIVSYDANVTTVLSGWDHIVAISKVSDFMRQRIAYELGDGTRERPWLHQKWPIDVISSQISNMDVALGCPAGYGMYDGDHYANTREQSRTFPAAPKLIEKAGPNGTTSIEVVPSGGDGAATSLQRNIHNTVTSWRFPVKPRYTEDGSGVLCSKHSDCGNSALSPDSRVVGNNFVCVGDATALTFCGPAGVCMLCRSERFAIGNAAILGGQCISQGDGGLPVNSRCGTNLSDVTHVSASRRCPGNAQTFCSGLTGMCTPCLEKSLATETTYTDDMAAAYMPCDANNRCSGDTGQFPYKCSVPGTRLYCDTTGLSELPSYLKGMVSPWVKASMIGAFATRGICRPCAQFVKNLVALPFLGWSFCVPCRSGFVSKDGERSCKPCPAGTVPQVTSGANGQLAAYTECAPCNRNSHGVVHFKFGTSPDLNNAYNDQGSVFGATVCIACNSIGMNHYRDPSTGKCKACEAGKASSTGTVGDGSAPACDVCAPGYYRNDTGGGSGNAVDNFNFRCTVCPAGTFTSNTKDTDKLPFDARCKKCPPARSTDNRTGFILNNTDQPCIKCASGKFAQDAGNAVCKSCTEEGNEMVPNAMRNGCRQCGKGTTRDRLVDQNVTTVDPDFGTQWRVLLRGVRLSLSPDGCVWCAPGYYRDNALANDAKGCQACPAGKFSNSPKSTECMECPPGRYTDATAQVQCKACPLGKATRHERLPASISDTGKPEILYETGAKQCLEICDTSFAWRFAEQFEGIPLSESGAGDSTLGDLYPSLAEGSKTCCINIRTGDPAVCPQDPSVRNTEKQDELLYNESLLKPFYANTFGLTVVLFICVYLVVACVFVVILKKILHGKDDDDNPYDFVFNMIKKSEILGNTDPMLQSRK